MKTIVRSSNYYPKLANQIKHDKLTKIFKKYTIELQKLVDKFTYETNLPKFANKDITDGINLPSRLSQVVAKQAIAISKSIANKVELARKTNKHKKYQVELLSKYTTKQLKIDIRSVNIELDSRFISITKEKNTKICDYWIKITSFPIKSFHIPLKLTNHMKDLLARGFVMKTTNIRVNSNGSICVYFEKPIKIVKKLIKPKTTGLDLGRNKLFVTNENTRELTHRTSKPIKEIIATIARRKHGSIRQHKSRAYLINQINYALKRCIDFTSIDVLITENLKDMKRNKSWGYQSHAWRIGYVGEKLQQLLEENDVQLIQVNAAYTSQSCSVCGLRHESNRKGEVFLCTKCGYLGDADHNAAINIHTRGIHSSSMKKICL